MMYSTKVIGLAALLFIWPCSPLAADNVRDVQDLLKQRLDAAMAVLDNEELSFEERKAEISGIVSPMFNFELMASLTLGRKQWGAMTQQQREKFSALFSELLRGTYLDRISLYTDEKVIINDSFAVGKRKVHIDTDLVTKGDNISMLYKFYQSDDRWGIYDVEIEGVSLIRSYLNQFKEFLRTGTIDDLIQKMEEPEKT